MQSIDTQPSRRVFLKASAASLVAAFLPSTLLACLDASSAAARGGHLNLLPAIPKFGENPYAQAAIARLKTLTESEKVTAFAGFSRSTSPFDVGLAGHDVLELIRAYNYDESPLKGSSDLLKSIVDRCDCIFAYAKKMSNDDDFGYLAQLSEILLMLSELMPTQVSKVRMEEWTAILEELLNVTAAKHTQHLVLADLPRAWAMADVRILAALTYGGMVLPRTKHKSLGLSGLRLMDKVLEPDGGVNYSDEQNDCFAYHPIYVTTLARLFQITGEKSAAELVAATQWYIPVSTAASGVAEYYTAPCWKQIWDKTDAADAAAIVVGITGSTYNAGHLKHFAPPASLFLASFYRDDVKADSLPDAYIFHDQNIKGPRGRNGNYSFAATGRATPGSNRGKSTYVGCLVTDEAEQTKLLAQSEASYRLNAALAGVGIEVTNSPRIDYMHAVPDDLLNLAQRETIAVTTTEKAGALSAHHRLSAYRRNASDWFVSQAWLLTPERMVGLLDVHALSDQLGCDIKGVLRFVSGCEDWGTSKKFVEAGENTYTYGALTARIIEHDFASLSFYYNNTFNDTARKAGRLVLSTQATGMKMYPLGTGHFFVAEIFASKFGPAKSIKRLTNLPGIIGLDVEESAGQRYQLVVNDTSGALDLGPTYREQKQTHIHDSGETYRLPCLPPVPSQDSPLKSLGKLAELATLASLMDPDGKAAKGTIADTEKDKDPFVLKPYRHKLIML